MAWTLRAEGGVRAADRDEVRRALAILVDPGQTFELRGLPSARYWVGRGSDADGAVEAAWDLSDGIGVYYVGNPCRADLDTRANNPDILSRRWLPLDCDPVRPGRSSATDDEKMAGIAQARSIGEYLSSEGFPDPVWVDSGNGVQLLYRIELPHDELSRRWVKAILARVADRTDTDRSKVDRAMHRAAQLLKLPGTWARKGDGTGDRPHRMARLVSVPPTVQVVPIDLLREMAGGADTNSKGGIHGEGSVPPANGQAAKNPWGLRAGSRSLDAYVQSAIRRECAALEATPQGSRNNALNAAAFSLGTMAAWPEMSHADAKLALYEAAKRSGLGEQEIAATLRSGWDDGAAMGRPRPEDAPRAGKSRAGTGPAAKPHDPDRRLIVWAKDITPRKVDWLWPGRIPVGKATTFAGQTGMGKTFAVCDIAARVSAGGEIPSCGGECFRQGKVLIISAEDDADDTIVPRLIDLGADLSQIAFLSPEAEADFNLGALELLNNSLDQMAGDVRMVAIDPPTSYLAGADDHRNAELRGLLAPLRRWTAGRRVALILVTHINKGGTGNVDAMSRVMGSAAWVQAVRAAHMFCEDPNARGKGLFIPLKVNNARKPPGIGYWITEDSDGRVTIEWLGEVDTTADEAMERKLPRKSVGQTVVEWYEEQFRLKREWSSRDLLNRGKAYGFSFNALCKSKEYLALPIDMRERFDGEGNSLGWFKIARPGWPPSLQAETPETLDTNPFSETENGLSGVSEVESESPESPETAGGGVSGVSGDSPRSGGGCWPKPGPKPGEEPEQGPPPGWEKPPGWKDDWVYYSGKDKPKED
jgi:hypothetical protein